MTSVGHFCFGVIMTLMKILWKIYKIAAIIMVSVLLVDLAVVMFFSYYRPNINQKADAIIILGAAINTPALYNRSLEGLRLYKQGDADVLVLSGGQDYNGAMTEAAYMKKVIDANSEGLAPVLIEDQSHSTYDNIKNSKELIGSGRSVIIVSDEFHLARGVIMAKREGFGPIYWSAPKPTYYSKKELALYYLREMVAMIDYIPKFIFG